MHDRATSALQDDHHVPNSNESGYSKKENGQPECGPDASPNYMLFLQDCCTLLPRYVSFSESLRQTSPLRDSIDSWQHALEYAVSIRTLSSLSAAGIIYEAQIMKLWQKLCVVLFVVSLIGFKIIQNSESRAAIQNGSVNEFWYVVCGVDVDGSLGAPGWIAGPNAVRGAWAYYSKLGYCRDMLYRVRLDEAARQLPNVVKLV